MKKTVSMNDFFEAFDKHDRMSQFPNTLAMLFNHLEELEQDTGDEIELDVIALCCDFTEWWIPDLADEFATDNEQIKHALKYAYNDRTHWSGDGLGYVVLSEADFENLRLLVDEREQEKRDAIADALEDLAENIMAITRDAEDSNKPIPDLLDDLDGYIEDFLHDYRQDVDEFRD